MKNSLTRTLYPPMGRQLEISASLPTGDPLTLEVVYRDETGQITANLAWVHGSGQVALRCWPTQVNGGGEPLRQTWLQLSQGAPPGPGYALRVTAGPLGDGATGGDDPGGSPVDLTGLVLHVSGAALGSSRGGNVFAQCPDAIFGNAALFRGAETDSAGTYLASRVIALMTRASLELPNPPVTGPIEATRGGRLCVSSARWVKVAGRPVGLLDLSPLADSEGDRIDLRWEGPDGSLEWSLPIEVATGIGRVVGFDDALPVALIDLNPSGAPRLVAGPSSQGFGHMGWDLRWADS